MTTVYRSTDVPADSFVDYWRHASRETFGPARLRPAGAPQCLRVGEVGGVRVAEMTTRELEPSTPCEGSATGPAGRAAYRVQLVLRGQLVLEQDDRESRLRPGDFALLDMSRPARWAAAAERFVALMFPPELLPVRPDDVAPLTAVGIRGDTGSGALFASLTRQLAHRLDEYDAVDAPHIGTALLDLFAAALTARADRGQPALDSPGRLLVTRIRAYIEAHLADPALSPAEVAAAHHISLRYLYKLFEPSGESVAGRIRRRRLERCRRDLLDPTTADRPVATIAARHGLTNPAHFSRLFKAAYGASPAEYRVECRSTKS